LFDVRIIEVRPNVRQVEIHLILPRGLIDPIHIIDALRLNQRADRPTPDAHSAALRIGPFGLQFSVANNVCMQLALLPATTFAKAWGALASPIELTYRSRAFMRGMQASNSGILPNGSNQALNLNL
jgi:hypothetical protein